MAQRATSIWRPALGLALPGLLSPVGRRAKEARAATLTSDALVAAPWTWPDLGRVLLGSSALLIGGLVSLFVLRIFLEAGCGAAASLHLVPPDAFRSLFALASPYLVAGSWALLGLLLCGAVLYSVYRQTIGRYALRADALFLRHAGWRTYGHVALLIIPLSIVSALVTRIEARAMGGTLQNPQTTALASGVSAKPLNAVLLLLFLAVFLPIAEEVFFRGLLYRLLRGSLPVWAAAAGSAAVFAAAHGMPLLFPWLFFLGIVLALVVEHTRSLYCGILLHMLVNAVAALSVLALIVGH